MSLHFLSCFSPLFFGHSFSFFLPSILTCCRYPLINNMVEGSIATQQEGACVPKWCLFLLYGLHGLHLLPPVSFYSILPFISLFPFSYLSFLPLRTLRFPRCFKWKICCRHVYICNLLANAHLHHFCKFTVKRDCISDTHLATSLTSHPSILSFFLFLSFFFFS